MTAADLMQPTPGSGDHSSVVIKLPLHHMPLWYLLGEAHQLVRVESEGSNAKRRTYVLFLFYIGGRVGWARGCGGRGLADYRGTGLRALVTGFGIRF